ncbi:MAG: hypothetical protein IJQ89_00315 [Bacteroidales bacterium]|nr:hypothetical protein [Bacteroidales bacterium]MBQ6724998.1 hypothetical protein [Bacteroidales bacterium]
MMLSKLVHLSGFANPYTKACWITNPTRRKNISIALVNFIFISFILMSCGNDSYVTKINNAQKTATKSYLKEIEKTQSAFYKTRKIHSATVDSLIGIFVSTSGRDTIFILEDYGYRTGGYLFLCWKKSGENYLYCSYCIDNKIKKNYLIDEYDLRLINYIEKWDKKLMREQECSYSKLFWGRHVVYSTATRMVFVDNKCSEVESIVFRKLDFSNPIDAIWSIEF